MTDLHRKGSRLRTGQGERPNPDLQAGGFQMYNQETGEPIGNPMEYIRDGLRFGKLSGGQQHLIYILRHVALQILGCFQLAF